MRRTLLAATAAAGLLVGGGMRPAEADKQGAWAERVQILYQADTGSVVRARVRVWDPHPEKNLDFVWEPARSSAPGIGEDAAAEGQGKLVWRVKGSASYDPRTIYSVYQGGMKAGRPDGAGRLEIRTGESFEGTFVEGALEGQGRRFYVNGDRYEGPFVHGEPEGEGRLMLATGAIYEGQFARGLRHGTGKLRLAGGTEYQSTWENGREIGTPPSALADATLGGLLQAQAGGSGDAAKADFTVAVDARMTQSAEMQYQHLVRDNDVAIYPVDEAMNDAWNGTGEISGGAPFTGLDFADAPAFVEVRLATRDGSRVKLDKIDLEVAQSEAYRKPMLSVEEHLGCVGFRPTFSFRNNGWGDVKNARLSVKFTTYDDPEKTSAAFPVDLGSFKDGVDVSLRAALKQAGVEVDKLEKTRFPCKSAAAVNVCRSQLFNKVKFGAVTPLVGGDQVISTVASGTIDYNWSDDRGNSYAQQEKFSVPVNLAVIETPEGAAECGDGFGGSPEALRYQEVKFPVGKQNYAIPLTLRGNKTVSNVTTLLKLSAEMSSIHRFNAVASFADGSTRRSKPVTFFFYRPKPSGFESKAAPKACYLPPDLGAC